MHVQKPIATAPHRPGRDPAEPDDCVDPCVARGTNDSLRTRYFYSMLLEAEDLSVDQAFHLQNIRNHNAELHGYGTVCGLKVHELDDACPWKVTVNRGVALDCLGRRIEVSRDVEIDLESAARRAFIGKVKREIRDEGAYASDQDRPTPTDERYWRDHVELWIGLCYQERGERPVQSLGGPETCCQPTCDDSRVRHGWCLTITEEPFGEPERTARLPRTIAEDLNPHDCRPDDVRRWLCDYLTCDCAPCEPDPCDRLGHCLTLARLRVDPRGHVSHVDNCVRPFAIPTFLIAELLLFAFERKMR